MRPEATCAARAGTPVAMSTTEARTPRAYEAVEAVARVEALDGPADSISKLVRNLLPKPIKDALAGSWLGHAVHPMLTDVPIGSWTSAVLLDWLGGEDAQKGADRLIALGLLAVAPTAAAGAVDWADSTAGNPRVKRIGLTHGLINVGASVLFAGSLAARVRGDRGRGKLLALAGWAVAGSSAYLGGHLSLAEGLGVDQTAFEQPPEDWTGVLDESALVEGRPQRVEAGGIPVLLVRQGGELFALSDRCAHRGGPLHEGELSDGCVKCPWHGSVFRLRDGGVEEGPTAYPQPAWETRVSRDRIEVRPAGDG